jgi:hypothetical protein
MRKFEAWENGMRIKEEYKSQGNAEPKKRKGM